MIKRRAQQGQTRKTTLQGLWKEYLEPDALSLLTTSDHEIKVPISYEFFEPSIQRLLRRFYKPVVEPVDDKRLSLPIAVYQVCKELVQIVDRSKCRDIPPAQSSYFMRRFVAGPSGHFENLYQQAPKACAAVLQAMTTLWETWPRTRVRHFLNDCEHLKLKHQGGSLPDLLVPRGDSDPLIPWVELAAYCAAYLPKSCPNGCDSNRLASEFQKEESRQKKILSNWTRELSAFVRHSAGPRAVQ